MGGGHQRQCRREAKAARRSTNSAGRAIARAVERLAALLDSADERIQLEAAKAILDRHLGRPAIQADINLNPNAADSHIAALVEMARRRALEPIVLDDDQVEIISTTPPSTS
jgi:hypothetical protein